MALSLASKKCSQMIAQIIMLYSKKIRYNFNKNARVYRSNLNVSLENIPYQDFNETYNCNF